MPLQLGTVLTIIIGVGGVTAALVAPLYILVLKMYGSGSAAEKERGDLGDTQDQIESELQSIHNEVEDLRTEVRMNGQRSETNQKHIHQLLVGKIDDDDNDIGNPHYKAEHCPLGDVCPWHDHAE